MGFIKDRFLYRDDYFPALQGLRGLAVLWFIHYGFYAQFDSAKVARLMDGRPWMEGVIGAAIVALSPAALLAALIMCVLGGFFAERVAGRKTAFGGGDAAGSGASGPSVLSVARSRLARFYPVFLVSILPILAYTGCDLAGLIQALTTFTLSRDVLAGEMVLLARSFWIPFLWLVLRAATRGRPGIALPVVLFLAVAGIDYFFFGDVRTTASFPAVLAGALAARFAPGRPFRPWAGPMLVFALILTILFLPYPRHLTFIATFAISSLVALSVLSLCAKPASFTARLLSRPFLRFFGAVALPFYLIHTTWGFRLSRAILQTELRSPADIAVHYAISLGVSILAAGFLHIFFERPHFLRNAPSADTHPSSATQGASP